MMSLGLLIIDMQNAYFQDPQLAIQKERVVERCNELIAAARIHHVPVWSIVTEHASDRSTWTLNMNDDNQGFLFHGSKEAELVEGLEAEGAQEIIKTRDSAFVGTQLAEKLTAAGVDKIILCGVSTHSCIMQTAADAYARDLRVLLAVEAIATNKPEFHKPSLKLLETEYRQTQASNVELSAPMAGTEF